MTKTYNNGQSFFDLIIVDSDTALFRAASSVEETVIKVTYKLTGESKEFKNITTFAKGEDCFIKDMNKFLGLSLKKDDFEIQPITRLRGDISNHIEEGVKIFDYFVGSIKNLGYAEDYKLALGGEGNFRYQEATIQPYKGHRVEKPLLFSEIRSIILSKYRSKILLANDCEADDLLGIHGAESQKQFLKTGRYKYLLAYIDKDIKQVWGASLFLNRKEDGIQFIKPLEAAKFFCYQLLKGDATDNIQGLPDLAVETREKYSLRKAKGCGDVASKAILEGCNDIPELLVNVLDAYQAYYGKEKYKSYLKENAILLYMQRYPEQRFDIFEELLKPFSAKNDKLRELLND